MPKGKKSKEVKKAKGVTTIVGSTKQNSRFQLASSSYYLASIVDPFNFPGSKVPDAITLPSATIQASQRIQHTVNANGLAGILVGFGNLTSTSGYQTSSTTSSPSSLLWNTAVGKDYQASVSSVSSLARLVSGYVSFEYQGAPLNRKGRGVLVFFPQSRQASVPGTSTMFLRETFSEDVNVAKKPFGMVRYIPQDSNSLVYTTPTTFTGAGIGALVLDGCTSGDIVEFTIVENYEIIPNANTANLIMPTPSINDPIELAVATNAITTNPSFPVSQPSRDPAEGKSPGVMRVHPPESTHHTGREATMFERVLDGITKSLPVAKDVVGTGISIAGMLAPLLL